MMFHRLSSSLSTFNLFLFVLLSFLMIFSTRLVLPTWMLPAGRIHALVLHLPIGFFFFHLVLLFFKKEIEPASYRKINSTLLHITGTTALISALFGLLLSNEVGEYDHDEIFSHKFMGYLFSLGCYIYSELYDKMDKPSSISSVVLLTGILFWAGHEGAEITHGENFILPTKESKKVDRKNDADASVYQRLIYPILEEKCVSCHNPRKTKGGLLMSDIKSLKKGGKTGLAIVPYDIDKSLLTKYILLPEDDKLHMAPKGKKQLNDEEKNILIEWVKSGASFSNKADTYDPNTPFGKFVSKLNTIKAEEKIYTFAPASESVINNLITPYRSIKSLNYGSPALSVNYILEDGFEAKSLNDLSKIKEQMVHLNLSRMPLKNEDLSRLEGFTQLEKLFLNETNLTSIDKLGKLPQLEYLSLMNTNLMGGLSEQLEKFPKLKKLFLSQSTINKNEIARLKEKYPHISVISNYTSQDSVKLTPPILDQKTIVIEEDGIKLKHNIKGVEIRYTLDKNEVDSMSPLYTKPIRIDSIVIIKARAFAPGWVASKTMTATVVPKGKIPVDVVLNSQPEIKRPGASPYVLIDKKRASSGNHTELGYIGYSENNFDATFSFEEAIKLSSIKISHNNLTGVQMYPPRAIEIYSGETKNNLQHIKTKQIPPVKEVPYGQTFTGIDFTIDKPHKYFRVVAVCNRKLSPGSPKNSNLTGGLLIDEVLFY